MNLKVANGWKIGVRFLGGRGQSRRLCELPKLLWNCSWNLSLERSGQNIILTNNLHRVARLGRRSLYVRFLMRFHYSLHKCERSSSTSKKVFGRLFYHRSALAISVHSPCFVSGNAIYIMQEYTNLPKSIRATLGTERMTWRTFHIDKSRVAPYHKVQGYS